MTRQRSLSRPRGRSPPTSSQRDRHKTRESSMSRSPVRHPTKTANGDDVDADIAVRPLPKYSRPSSPLAEKVSVGKEETARKSVKGSALSGSLARSRTLQVRQEAASEQGPGLGPDPVGRITLLVQCLGLDLAQFLVPDLVQFPGLDLAQFLDLGPAPILPDRLIHIDLEVAVLFLVPDLGHILGLDLARGPDLLVLDFVKDQGQGVGHLLLVAHFVEAKVLPEPPVTVYPLTNNVEKAHVREILTYFGDVVRVDLQRVRGGSANGDGGLKIAEIATTSSENDHDNGTGDLKNTPHQKAIVEMSTVKDADEVVHGMHNGMIDGLTINVVMLTAVENENRFKGISGSNMDRAGGNQGGSDRGRSRMMDSRLPARNGRGRIGFNSMREDRRPFQRSGARSRSRSISRSPSRKRLAEGGRRDPVRGRFRSPPRRDVRKWSPSRR
ncbi:LOW QUALITY PROTEIN: expressed protein [Batrachochytrium dendrobatidis JAM81]|uniref:Expressed protein n=1 Tax=Batrachochytrium dendrobatidis (strain JAM81 / FGSC 10211) TaxID=684364 RepID=F4NRY9_BATDJ|nr:LOW QUALITY PROTEIN: uncharacterized protein BATDEDRAFT_85688 [Batrachochytrium dendrobatidis JAM81]EGF82979.1 LOW QUALITY PROTEIN: expressed protein [Batrachochytrium dendrobatidis JAM81]|eukprot:XP_006675933.1 LOW QUALITY PROTEIN: expressed protein [Batrachochytrium dendrobatidis JAM81]